MDDDEVQSPEQDSPTNYIDIKELMPANPIYDKPATEQPKPVLRIEIVKNEIMSREPLRPVFKKESESEEEEEESVEEPQCPFEMHYQEAKCLFRKINNDEVNMLMHTKYFASCFVDKRLFRQNKEPLGSLEQLQKEVLDDTPESAGPSGKNEVRFDSNFQSGNLFAVYKKNPTEYDLVLQNDVNSKGNTQWFYFTVTNLPQNVEVTFNIVNLLKSDSLFNYGMQPVVLSEAKLKKSGEGWSRQGRCITYTKNTIRRQRSKRFYYTLSFKLTSRIASDTLHVAHCFPYTYSQLKEYLSSLVKSSPKKGTIISRSTIGKTVGNNPIEVLTITDTLEKKPDNRKIIVIMARQHPGETQGSLVCEGVMTFLVSKKAEWLRKNFVFKIIPMVNPDGVIFGNYRSNLMGFDLNRKWDVYDKDGCFPEVRSIKEYISELNKQKRVKVILDLHGHSKKLNSFFYGNPCPQNPELVRGFPYTCARLNPQISFQDCTFTIEEQKRKAARVYLSLTHHLINVYTFQSSFYGYTKDNKKYPFGIEQFKGLGASLMQGLNSFLEYDQLQEQKAMDKLPLTQYFKYMVELKENPNLIQVGDRRESGSQSNPQEYEMKGTVEAIIGGSVLADPENQTKSINEGDDTEQARRQKQLAAQERVPGSRKGKRQLKEVTKNPRQLKVMQISRVNSILPDKYQLALQPAPHVSQPIDRKRSTLRQSLKDIKVNICTQTNPMEQGRWEQLKVIDIDEIEEKFTPSKNTVQTRQTRPPSGKFKDNYDVKYISLTSTKNKKNGNILKLDVLSTRPLEPARVYELGSSMYGSSSSLVRTKNRFSQTFLTYTGKTTKFRSITHFPSVDCAVERAETRQDPPKAKAVQIFKANRLNSKRDNQDFLNEMVRKYLVNIKDRNKVKPIVSQEERIFYEKSSPVRAEDLNQRPLSIKKKEIFTSKKLNSKSRS